MNNQALDATHNAQTDTKSSASTSKLFDRTVSPIRVTVPDPNSPTGKKAFLVRYPTDEEWCDRAKSLVQIRKSLPGGKTAYETSPAARRANTTLLNAILVMNDGTTPMFTEAEAAHIIGRLERCEVTECVQEGVNFTIKMVVMGSKEVVHVLKMPDMQTVMDLGHRSVQIQGSRNQTMETRTLLQPVIDAWKKQIQKVEGYYVNPLQSADSPHVQWSEIPAPHMDVALNELIAQTNASVEGDDPEV